MDQKYSEEERFKQRIIEKMRKAHPHASEELLEEGFHNLVRYVEVTSNIAERLEREKRQKSSIPDRSVDDSELG